MKKNRIIAFFLVVVSMLALTGCLEIADISEEKSDLVAEYAAGILLRNSDTYEKRLITKEDLKRRGEEATATSTPAVTVTATPTAEATSAPAEADNASGSAVSATEIPTVALNEVYALSGINVQYTGYAYYDKYKDSSSQITAKNGNVLLVTKFKVTNTSGSKQKIQLGQKKIEYILDVDGSQYSPGISILDNMGMNFLNTSIDAGKSEEAVLVFEMSNEKRTAQSIKMTVKKDSKISEINIK